MTLNLDKTYEQLNKEIFKFKSIVSENHNEFLKLQNENIELKTQVEQLTEDNNRLKDSIISIGKVVKENKEKWKYLEGRFVKVDYCTEEQRTHCPLYPLDCQGDNCKQFIDLVDLLDKACDSAKVN